MKAGFEYVSSGHPDRVCDSLAANLIQKIQANNKLESHAAIEVFASDDTIVFGGEAKTSLKLNKKFLRNVVKETFYDCGYIPSRRLSFKKKDEVYLAKDVKILNKIHAQSPDIAIATTDQSEGSGWNDQNISFGSYDVLTPTGQGVGKFLAQSFGDYLFNVSFTKTSLGSDIKIVFVLDYDKDGYTPKSIEHITVAIPSKLENIQDQVKTAYECWKVRIIGDKENREVALEKYPVLVNLLENSTPEFTINGTGRYVNHGFHSDSSMTGRKLAVNNMSAGPINSMCQCGGGSYIKPWHASDFLLPMLCNWIAAGIVKSGISKYANVAVSCTIGQRHLDSISITGDNKSVVNDPVWQENFLAELSKLKLSPSDLMKKWSLLEPESFDFYKAAKQNFVGKCVSLDKDVDTTNTPWFANVDEIKEIVYKISVKPTEKKRKSKKAKTED